MRNLSTNPRVLLCTAYRRFAGDYFDIADTATYRVPKMNLPYRVSSGLRFIKQNVPEVEILEYPLWDEYVTRLKEGWDVVGFSFYNVEIGEIERMAEEARRHGVKELWAGNYGALDERIPSIVDRIFIGPAEDEIAQVFGYRVRDDEIEHPVMLTHALLVPGNLRILTSGLLYTQHGCPFKCTFCQSSVFEKRRFTINLESIKRILKYYRKIGVNYIGIMDETFGSDPKFTDHITQLLHHYKFYWWAQTRVEIIKRRLDEWYERGLRMPAIGVECMFQSTLSAVNKGQRIADIIDYAHCSGGKPGMFRAMYYMVGFEDMTAEETLEDAERVSKLGFDMSTVGIITPYPKTPFWYSVNSKYGIFDNDCRHYDNEHLVWNHPGISAGEMMQLRKRVLEVLNKPTNIYLKKFIKGLQRKNSDFLWRYVVKGPIVSRMIDDRKKIFLPKLPNTSG
jgi:radical SAM superfamily enzyme YgiQ (UPF0313 family)